MYTSKEIYANQKEMMLSKISLRFFALFKRKLIEIRSLISTLNESFKLIRWYKSF